MFRGGKMPGYKPPIEAVIRNMQSHTEQILTDDVLGRLMVLDIHVDKEELIKALEYHRGQYEKGYRDGCRDSQRCGQWIAVPSSDMSTGKAYKCSECSKMRYGSYHPNYCQYCGAKMDGERREGE